MGTEGKYQKKYSRIVWEIDKYSWNKCISREGKYYKGDKGQ